MDEQDCRIRLLLDVDQRLKRELLERIIELQTDLHLTEFEAEGIEATLWTAIEDELSQCNDDDKIVVITSVENYGMDSFHAVCSRWLMEFPELHVIAIDWSHEQVFSLRNEVRCVTISNSLVGILSAVRQT